jgi:O-antigen/teichoic acid export membrane protein
MRIVQAACVTGLQIALGLNDATAAGLATAHCLGVACGLLVAFWMLPLSVGHPQKQSWRRALQSFFVRHQRLPLLSLPADTVNAASSQLPLLIVTSRYGAEIGGYLALTLRILGGPISLLGAAVLDVFKRHAAQSYNERGECVGEFVRTFKILAAASTVFVVVLLQFSERLFSLAFGVAWVQAGTIATWMLPLFALRFVASPLSYMFYVAQKQHIDLAWQLTLLAITVASLMLPYTYATALQTYSAGYSVMYVIYLFLSYRFSLGARG